MKTMHSRLPRALSGAALVVLAALLLSPASAQVYTELFTNTGGANQTAGQIGWSAFVSSTATNVTSVAGVGGTDYVAVASGAGNPGTPTGFIFANNGATSKQTFALVDVNLTPSSSLTLNNGDSITWTMGNNATDATAQILIQIGGTGTVNSGTWYVSTAVKSNSTSYSTTTYQQATTSAVTFTLAFSSAAANWQTFTLNPGTGMSVGSVLASDLTDTTITGIGFYLTDGSSIGSSMRLDNLQIIPEPTSLAMGLMGCGLLWVTRRRREK